MKSIILRTATTYILPLLLLFSVFVLLRGHNESGGGFVGGLIASIAFVLHSLAFGVKSAQALFSHLPGFLIPVGLSLSIISSMFPVFLGKPIMTGIWLDYPLPIIESLGTALFFDIGVYFVVIGAMLTILFTISESV